jgi:hypothetical protein
MVCYCFACDNCCCSCFRTIRFTGFVWKIIYERVRITNWVRRTNARVFQFNKYTWIAAANIRK